MTVLVARAFPDLVIKMDRLVVNGAMTGQPNG